MPGSKLFSVVIPVFNRAHVIDDAIASVLSQTETSFEILVIDDGSSDDLAAVMSQHTDPRIRFIRQANSGASAARNHGIDLAMGRFIAFLDSDDVFLPHHLAAVAAALSGTVMTVVYSRVCAVRGRDTLVRPPRAIAQGEAMATYLMCDRGFVQTSGLVVPSQGARAVRYGVGVSYGDDTDFAIRLQLAGYRFIMMEEPGIMWFDGADPGRLSNVNLNSERLAWLEMLKPDIPARAYRGYRGWHLAKGLYEQHPFRAIGLYLVALFNGCYRPRLALVILAQIVVPRGIYRQGSDLGLRVATLLRRVPAFDVQAGLCKKR